MKLKKVFPFSRFLALLLAVALLLPANFMLSAEETAGLSNAGPLSAGIITGVSITDMPEPPSGWERAYYLTFNAAERPGSGDWTLSAAANHAFANILPANSDLSFVSTRPQGNIENRTIAGGVPQPSHAQAAWELPNNGTIVGDIEGPVWMRVLFAGQGNAAVINISSSEDPAVIAASMSGDQRQVLNAVTFQSDSDALNTYTITSINRSFIFSIAVYQPSGNGGNGLNWAALNSAISAAEGRVEADYTLESWAVFAGALSAARALLNAVPEPSQQEITDAASALVLAASGLVTVGGYPPSAAPANLRATAGDRQVRLDWDAVDGANDYFVWRQEYNLPNTATTPVLVGDVTNHTFTGLENGTNYTFFVRARNAHGQAAVYAQVNATPQGWVLYPAIEGSNVRLDITGPHASPHLIHNASARYMTHARLDVTAFFSDDGDNRGRGIYFGLGDADGDPIDNAVGFAVRANNAGVIADIGFGHVETRAAARTQNSRTMLITLNGTSGDASVGTTTANPNLASATGNTLNDTAGNVTNRYIMDVQIVGEVLTATFMINGVTTGRTITADVPAGTTIHSVYGWAERVGGNTTRMHINQWRLYDLSLPLERPADVTGFTATANADGTASLGWDAAEHAAWYYITVTPGAGWLSPFSFDATGTSHTITEGLTNGVEHTLTIRAHNRAYYSENAVNAADTITPYLAAATGVHAAGGIGHITLTWNEHPYAAGFYVHRSGDNIEWTQLTATPLPATATEFVDNGILGNFYYTVIPVNHAGVSAVNPSAVNAEATLPTDAPAGLPTLTVFPHNQRVTLEWTAVEHALYYYVWHQAAGSAAETTAWSDPLPPHVMRVPAANLTAEFTGLENDVPLRFFVRANNNVGFANALYIAYADATPNMPVHPLGLHADAWFESIHGIWTAHANHTGFRAYWSVAGQDDWQLINGTEQRTVHHPGSGGSATFTIDHSYLVREIDPAANIWRVDVPGLTARNNAAYDLLIIPVTALGDDNENIDIFRNLRPDEFDRTGFAFAPSSPFGGVEREHNTQTAGTWTNTIGGHLVDGRPHPDALIFYVTHENMNTFSNPWNNVGGLQGLFTAENRASNRPLANMPLVQAQPIIVRFVGQVGIGGNGSPVVPNNVTGHTKDVPRTANITLEGVGSDAVISGFGFRFNMSHNIEVRNLTFEYFADDALYLEGRDNPIRPNTTTAQPDWITTNNWLHHNTFRVGTAWIGTNRTGDGAIDANRASYFTVAYNHFINVSHTGLTGNALGSPAHVASYHHNWFENTGTRNFRIRMGDIHFFNNFFDGVRGYGIGGGHRANIIAEGNYFLNTNRPMIISGQGSVPNTLTGDAAGAILTTTIDDINQHSNPSAIQAIVDRLEPNAMVNVRSWNPATDQGAVSNHPNNNRGQHEFRMWSASNLDIAMDTAVTSAQDARDNVERFAGAMRTLDFPTTPDAPNAPAVAINEDHTFSVSWNRIANADDYLVEWYSGGGWAALGTTSSTNLTTTTQIAVEDTTYQFRVTARNTEGAATSVVTSITFTAPNAPAALVVTPGLNSLTLSWNAPVPAPSRYEVVITPQGGEPLTMSTTETHVVIEGLELDSYGISVYAMRGSLRSAALTGTGVVNLGLIEFLDLTDEVYSEDFESLPIGVARDDSVKDRMGFAILRNSPATLTEGTIGTNFPPSATAVPADLQDAYIVDDSGNRVLRLRDYSLGGDTGRNGYGMFVFFELDEEITAGRAVIEMRVMYDNNASGGMRPISVYGANGAQILHLTSTLLQTNNASFSDVWFDLRVVVDLDTRRFDVYVNDDVRLYNQELTGTGGIAVIASNTSTGQQSGAASQMGMLLDDISVRVIDPVGFTAVESITLADNVPRSFQPGSTLTLNALVAPANATNRTIVWSVYNAGTAGAQISGNTLSAATAGTITVKATIANGTANGQDFTETFTIYAVAPSDLTGNGVIDQDDLIMLAEFIVGTRNNFTDLQWAAINIFDVDADHPPLTPVLLSRLVSIARDFTNGLS